MINKNKGRMQRLTDAFCRLNEKDTDTVLYFFMCVLTVPAVLGFALYLWAVGFILPQDINGCMFRQVLHIYCPGCGGTRAVLALLQGKILTALFYHPAAVYGVILYIVYFISQTLKRLSRGSVRGIKFRIGYLWVMVALIAVNFIARNVLLLVYHIPTL